MSLSIQNVRDLLDKHGLSAIVIPTGDPHSSEYPCRHWQLRRALCPFTGSAGSVVITNDKALLWTDSRYWDQAREELAGTRLRNWHRGFVQIYLTAVESALMPALVH